MSILEKDRHPYETKGQRRTNMTLNYDREISIAVGTSRRANDWQNTQMLWSSFAERVKKPVKTLETLDQYLKLSKADQDELKDVGAYVGGECIGGIRSTPSIGGRDLVTLDYDNIDPAKLETLLQKADSLQIAMVIHSTRKHRPSAPRLRIIIPSSRTMHPEEYQPIARKLADMVDLSMIDGTTFEIARCMFWPSISSDGEYIYDVHDYPLMSPDWVLASYENWRDATTWPTASAEDRVRKAAKRKQQDPRTKNGAIGAFCRAFSVPEAIAEFLPGIYREENTGRYTYLAGSTTSGAIVYDDGAFLYSHHATDPVSEQLVNAYDLVRIHKFGSLDNDLPPGTPTIARPSYKAMMRWVKSLPAVRDELAADTINRAKAAMFDMAPGDEDDHLVVSEPTTADLEWIKTLDTDTKGNPLPTTDNIVKILTSDPTLRDAIAYDEFSEAVTVEQALPWDKAYKDRRWWTDMDDANLRYHLERVYHISSKDKTYDAVSVICNQRRFHEVREYLDSLTWDGIPRLDDLFIRYLGAEDNEYTRAATRKSLTAAVARIYQPGVKYDQMVILFGPQGIGKSTLLRILAGDWFSDSLQTFAGKEAAEMLRGTWINEIAELNALSYSDSSLVKQFLSKVDDIYRAAYGRRTIRHKRQCVFFGTSNRREFLRDKTGNRRFWPIDCSGKATASIWDDLESERDQIWAEAKAKYHAAEPLFLSGKLEDNARSAQESHLNTSAREGVIINFINKNIPENWYQMSIGARRAYWQSHEGKPDPKAIPRDKICAAEIYCECLNGDLKRLQWTDSNEINDILECLPGWVRNKAKRRYGPYGPQRGFEKGVK